MATNERLVLEFHGIGVPPDHVDRAELPFWCDQKRFVDILDSIPTISQLTGVPIELTFDDGNMSDVSVATPALVERGLSATFFVCAGRIGKPRYLDAPAMVQIIDAGMTIGSHGWSHIDWRTTDDKTLRKETKEARHRISDVIGCSVEAVAIPFNSYDRRVLRHLRDYRQVFVSDGVRASNAGRIVPRVTYQQHWDKNTLHHAATHRNSILVRLRRRLGAAYKAAALRG